jgi:acetyl-CoA C-acetyltransferase
MDAFALESHRKATAAAERFSSEIVPIDILLPDGSQATHMVDEGVRPGATLEGISGVKLIQEGGRLSAASASQICDGASGVLVVSERGLKALGRKPMARIHHLSVAGGDPVIMLEAPIAATTRALEKAGLGVDDIDLFEVNEAFASIPMAWIKATHADPAGVNVNGGAISLGHPLGSSGTRLMTTLVHELGRRKARYGLQTMCEGGGMANVTIVERL